MDVVVVVLKMMGRMKRRQNGGRRAKIGPY
jgi:hypothetical protein